MSGPAGQPGGVSRLVPSMEDLSGARGNKETRAARDSHREKRRAGPARVPRGKQEKTQGAGAALPGDSPPGASGLAPGRLARTSGSSRA